MSSSVDFLKIKADCVAFTLNSILHRSLISTRTISFVAFRILLAGRHSNQIPSDNAFGKAAPFTCTGFLS